MRSNISIPPQLIHVLQQAKHVVILTGAGVSAESGVPTFRDTLTGLWAKYDPHELATAQAFRRDPKLVWDWYAWRRELVASVAPNPAHIAIAKMAHYVPKLTLITQNVDGLHERAGSKSVIELHGNITKVKCFDMNHPISSWDESEQVPPFCPQCGSYLRPDVVWFGEHLPSERLETAVSATQTCDLFFSIGTSTLVQPAASLPLMAQQNNTPTVEVNPQPTPITYTMTYVLPHPAGEIMPALVHATWASE